jgi:hypothetical protein
MTGSRKANDFVLLTESNSVQNMPKNPKGKRENATKMYSRILKVP